MPIDRSAAALAAFAMLALAGCAAQPTRVAEAPPAPAPSTAMPMPQPPAGSYAGMIVPARLPDGSYATPNQHLTGAATVWHLRVALNVAALGCRGAEGQAITAGYNAMLGDRKAALAAAHAALIGESGGQDAYDEAMTRLYNYFAQPAAKTAFCTAAAEVVGTLAQSGSLDAVASPALAALDRPFTDFYRAYDAYRVQLAQWQSNRLQRALQPLDTAPRVAFATAATAPVAEQAPAAGPVPHLSVDPSIFERP
ncbi:MAG: hypothetical protein ACTHMG_10030 [Sphingomonas sp.]